MPAFALADSATADHSVYTPISLLLTQTLPAADHKGMIGEGEYISRNSLGLGTAMPRLTDDELANALTLDRMASYAKGGAQA